jgi:hypothetical protein
MEAWDTLRLDFVCLRAWLQRIEEGDELFLFFGSEIHLESLVVEVHQFIEISGRSVVEVRRAGSQAAKDWTLAPIDVGAQASNERFAWVGGVIVDGLAWIGGIWAVPDLVNWQVGCGQLLQGRGDGWAGFVGSLAAGGDVQGQGYGVVAYVGGVVAGGAGSRDGGWAAKGCVIVQAANASDDGRLRVEELFTCGYLLPCFFLFFVFAVAGVLLPCGVKREGAGVELCPGGVASKGIVFTGIVALCRESRWAAGCSLEMQLAGVVVADLRGGKAHFKLDDFCKLLCGRGLPLRMSQDGGFGLIGEIEIQIALESLGVVEGHQGFTAVEHDGAEVSEICRGQRPPIDGNYGLCGGGVQGDGASIGIMHDGDGELRVGRHCEANADEAAVKEKAVDGAVFRSVCRAVGSIDRGKERIFAVGALIDFANSLGADAEGLVCLMAGGATAAVGAKALKESALLVDVAGGVEGGYRASLVLKGFEIGDETGHCGGGTEGSQGQQQAQSRTTPDTFHSNLFLGGNIQRRPERAL